MTHPTKWWTPFVMLLVIVLVQAILFLVITQIVPGLDTAPTADEIPRACYSISKNVVIFFVVIVVLRRAGREARVILRLERVSIGQIVAGCLLILALVPWELFIWEDDGGVQMIRPGDPTHLNGALFISSVSVVFLTPLAEEFFFRGFALSVFGTRSLFVGVLGSCVLFGAYHFTGSAESFIRPLPFALAAAYSVVMTRSIYPAILAHAAWNLLGVAGDIGYVFGQPSRVTLLCSLMVGAICAVLLARAKGPRQEERVDDLPLP